MCEKQDSCDGLLGKYVQMVVGSRMMTAWLINEIRREQERESIMLVIFVNSIFGGFIIRVLGVPAIQPGNATVCVHISWSYVYRWKKMFNKLYAM